MKISYDPDPIIERLVNRFIKRSEEGMVKFGVSIDEQDSKNSTEWITDVQEELWDAIVYLEKLKKETEALEEYKWMYEELCE